MVITTANYSEISPSDWFYRNRDIAGFDNPTRALYTAVREVLENSLDACEFKRVLPTINLSITRENPNHKLSDHPEEPYRIRIEDNGSGIPQKHIPPSFGQIFYGSKFTLQQSRGIFGLGVTMAILYGQVTTHQPVRIISSHGDSRVYDITLKIDISQNKPVILKKQVHFNESSGSGTIVEFPIEGNWRGAKSRISKYLQQTVIITPHADITFTDPDGTIHNYPRSNSTLPPIPREVLPHPHGVDVEALQRAIKISKNENMISFMTKHFHRVGKKIAIRFLKFAGIDTDLIPRKLQPNTVILLAKAMKRFKEFLPPDIRCLSPLGKLGMIAGITKALNPEDGSIQYSQRPASAYNGHPFIVETAMAYGGSIPKAEDFTLYRFANRIPLLYDAYNDVSMRVIRNIRWNRYGISPQMPIAIFVHIASTKIPFKTVGKEYIADRPKIRYEIEWGLKECARGLKRFLSGKQRVKNQYRRFNVYRKYLPKLAQFATELAQEPQIPDLSSLLGEE